MTKNLSELHAWYQTPAGSALSDLLAKEMEEILPKCFGYYLLQLGMGACASWLNASPIHRHYILDINHTTGVDGVIEIDNLPLQTESTDVLVLPHTLEYVSNPRGLLQEAQRVLLPGGTLILTGFNPLSLWGLSKCFGQIPWAGHWYTSMSCSRLLEQSGFSQTYMNSCYYRPYVSNQTKLECYQFLDSVGHVLWPYPGAAYVISAKKTHHNMVAIKPLWGFKDYVIGKRYAPSSEGGLTTKPSIKLNP